MGGKGTIGSARAWAASEFKLAGMELPALSADLLLSHVLGLDRVHILTYPEELVEEKAWLRYKALVRRCAAGEPLQYLVGAQEFYGLLFRITPDVLIPRPETEILVERVLALAYRRPLPSLRFMDVGTGSGCIAVSIARQLPSARGWAVDISAQALEIARENAARHAVLERIHFVQSDLLECFVAEPTFDFILSNPPYVARADYERLPAIIRNHEPRNALFGGESGLDFYYRLIPEILPRLVPEGYLLIELGAGQAKQVTEIVEQQGLIWQEEVRDLQGIPHCLIARKSSKESNG